MEAAGLAIGIAGIAGLFNTCLDSLARFQSYKSSNTDSHILDTRFRAARTRFEQWGANVGISQGRLLENHHSGLDDENAQGVIHDILHIIIKTICENRNAQQNLLQDERFAGVLQSRRQRLRWALGGKEDRTEQVEIFEKLVQQLHNLVPVSLKGHQHSEEKGVSDWSDVRQILLNMEQGMRNEMRRDMYSWLGIPSFNDKYQDSLDQRVENTCGWIFERQQFKDWLSPRDSTSAGLLWINGPAGFGKTILCARVVQHLTTTLATPVAYFFFTSDIGNQDNVYLALRSWIYQVADAHEDAFECVRRAWESLPTNTASRRNLIDLFTDIVDAVPGLTFVADGLDECSQFGSDHSSMSQFLSDVVRAASNNNTKLLFVSRDEPEIRDSLEENAPEMFTEYRIAPDDVRSDTATFSQSIVDKKLSNKSDDIKTAISEAMTKKCEGQFLWIRMQEEALRKGMSKKRLHEAVENTPPGLDRLYDHNWNRILALSQWEKDRAFALLRWAAFAYRALSVYEITEAALITQFEELDPEEYPDEFDNEYTRTEIIGLCGPLLEVKAMVIHIPHFSVRQYLGQHLPLPSWIQHNGQLQGSYETYHHTVLAKALLQYLKQPQVWKTRYDRNSTDKSLRWYAIVMWVKHVKNASQDPHIWELATEMMREENPLWKLFSEFQAEVMKDREGEDATPTNGQPLHTLEYAIYWEWKEMANYLITEDNVNRIGVTGMKPLAQACALDMPETVERLLDAGADWTSTLPGKRTFLHVAAWFGIDENVKILLRCGTDSSSRDENGSTPLHAAAMNGNLKCCEILIKSGADPSVQDETGWTPLHAAARAGNLKCCELLINSDAGLSVQDADGWTPLHEAAVKGNLKCCKLLIKSGVDVTAKDSRGLTALHKACLESGRSEVVKLILQNGPDSMAVERCTGGSPLHLVCITGDVEVAKVLLDSGAAASFVVYNEGGATPLMMAAHNDHTELVSLLLNEGADATLSMATKDDKRTFMHILALGEHSDEMIRTSLRQGVEKSMLMEDEGGCIPLHLASQCGRTNLVKLILDYVHSNTQAMVEGKDLFLLTPLRVAAYHGHLDIIKALLEHGAETTITLGDKNGHTPLWVASYKGHLEVVRLLLDHGAVSTIDAPDFRGKTALYAALSTGRVEIARELLARGAESTLITTTKLGNSPLYAACKSGKLDIVNLLLEHGAEDDITTLTIEGRSPLFAAAETGNLEIFHKLLDLPGAETTLLLLDDFDRSLLTAASCGGCVEVVQVLLDHGVGKHIGLPTKYGTTPLHCAASHGFVDIVQLFLTIPKVAINHMNIYGVSPLFEAARFGHLSTVKVLLSNEDIDLNGENWKAITPAHAAIANGHTEVAEVLISSGATFYKWPTIGRSLLWWAKRTGKAEMVQLMKSIGITAETLGPLRYFHKDAPPDDAATVAFDSSLGYCDVCTLTVGVDEGHGCNKCCNQFGEGMFICSECFDRGYDVCRNDHRLVPRKELDY